MCRKLITAKTCAFSMGNVVKSDDLLRAVQIDSLLNEITVRLPVRSVESFLNFAQACRNILKLTPVTEKEQDNRNIGICVGSYLVRGVQQDIVPIVIQK